MPSTHRTERSGSGTITISPKNEADQSALVVISHGLGDSSEGFVDVAENLAASMPYMKFILPTAPTQKVTMNMGMEMPSWYDITGLDERSNENCPGIEESRSTITGILEAEHESTKLPYSRMVLAGFSQGGALSLYTGLQLQQKLAGVVMMSAYLPAAKKFTVTPGLEDTPILHCHGTQDPLLHLSIAEKTKTVLTTEKGIKAYELKTYPGLQHSVNMSVLADVKSFIEKVLPPDDSCKIQLKDPEDMSVKELKAAIRNAGQSFAGLFEKREFIEKVKEIRSSNL